MKEECEGQVLLLFVLVAEALFEQRGLGGQLVKDKPEAWPIPGFFFFFFLTCLFIFGCVGSSLLHACFL